MLAPGKGCARCPVAMLGARGGDGERIRGGNRHALLRVARGQLRAPLALRCARLPRKLAGDGQRASPTGAPSSGGVGVIVVGELAVIGGEEHECSEQH